MNAEVPAPASTTRRFGFARSGVRNASISARRDISNVRVARRVSGCCRISRLVHGSAALAGLGTADNRSDIGIARSVVVVERRADLRDDEVDWVERRAAVAI